MLTGTLTIVVTVSAKDEKDLERLSADIRHALKGVNGVSDSEEIDSDIDSDIDED